MSPWLICSHKHIHSILCFSNLSLCCRKNCCLPNSFQHWLTLEWLPLPCQLLLASFSPPAWRESIAGAASVCGGPSLCTQMEARVKEGKNKSWNVAASWNPLILLSFCQPGWPVSCPGLSVPKRDLKAVVGMLGSAPGLKCRELIFSFLHGFELSC